MRNLAPLIIMTSCCLSLAPAAETVTDPVRMRDLVLEPPPRWTTQGGVTRWHPYLGAYAQIDTNVFQSQEDPEQDLALGGYGGLQVDWDSPTANLRANGRVGYRDYQDFDERDQLVAHGDLHWERRSELSGYDLGIAFQQDQRPDVVSAQSSEHREIASHLTWWREGRFRQFRLTAIGRAREYDSGADRRNRNQGYAQARIEGDYLPAPGIDGRWGLLTALDFITYTDEDSLAQDGISAEAMGSWLRELDETSRLLLRAGVEIAYHNADYAEDEAYEDGIVIWPAGEIDWRRLLGPRGSFFGFKARSDLLPGERSNARTAVTGQAYARLWHSRHWISDGQLEGTFRRDSGAPAGEEPIIENSASITLGITYALRPGLQFRLSLEWRENRSTSDAFEYSQQIATFDAAAAF